MPAHVKEQYLENISTDLNADSYNEVTVVKQVHKNQKFENLEAEIFC